MKIRYFLLFIQLLLFGTLSVAATDAGGCEAGTGVEKTGLIYGGSFNPPTLGHLEMIRRLATDHRVTVVVAANPAKTYPVSPEVRKQLLRRILDAEGLSARVEVLSHNYSRPD